MVHMIYWSNSEFGYICFPEQIYYCIKLTNIKQHGLNFFHSINSHLLDTPITKINEKWKCMNFKT